LAHHPRADAHQERRIDPHAPETPLMSVETLEFLLLLSGWIVAFLLGRELQTGYRLWRLRTAEQRARHDG